MTMSTMLCLVLLTLGCSLCSAAPTNVIVTSPVGKVIGTMEPLHIDGQGRLVTTFLGVPYAESTAGKNRFQKPVPKASFSGTFDARNQPLACYHSTIDGMKGDQDTYDVPGYSEDCLTLNIYIPGDVTATNRKSVMLWIHGGGFNTGAASIFDGRMLSVFGDVIVVTINYRLGMFGFLQDSGANLIGNQGLWDQHLAIKWVHDNIASFSGDPDEITLFGESAGGAAVLLQALYEGNRGLIKRVIAESGSSIGYWPVTDESVSDQFITDQGCTGAGIDILTCLQTKDAQSLISNKTYSFAPSVDGDFLKARPQDIIFGNSSSTAGARDFYSSLNIIVGVNNYEGVVYIPVWKGIYGYPDLDFDITRDMFKNDFVPFVVNSSIPTKDEDTKAVLNNVIDFVYTNWTDPTNIHNLRRSTLDMYCDMTFFVGAQQAVQGHTLLNGTGRAYLYEFAVDVGFHALSVPSWFTGSTHGDEIIYVFGYPFRENGTWADGTSVNFTSADEALSRTLMTTWSTFAKSGTPADRSTFDSMWPAYTMDSQQYLKFTYNPQPTVEQRFYPHRMWLWNTMIPSILNIDKPLWS